MRPAPKINKISNIEKKQRDLYVQRQRKEAKIEIAITKLGLASKVIQPCQYIPNWWEQ